MNYDAFSHGQIISKKWLCDCLEPYLNPDSTVWILGSWYNVMAFMLLSRGNTTFKSIIGYDIDPVAKTTADLICNAWTCEQPTVTNIVADANLLDWSDPPDVVINCSGEHFVNTAWWTAVPESTVVAVQSSNVVDSGPIWNIQQPNPDFETFVGRYPMSNVFYSGTKFIPTEAGGYQRYMLIGKK